MTLEQSSQSILLEKFNETRARTLELVKTLEKDDFGVQTAFYTSPAKWHLGHVSWLNEIVLSKTTDNYEFYSDVLLRTISFNQLTWPRCHFAGLV
jgi:hypothetical protein